MTPAPNHRWSFSLRTLFVVVTVAALSCVAGPRLLQEYERWQRYRRAEQVVHQLRLLEPIDVADGGPLGGPPSTADWERMTKRRDSRP